MERGEATTIEHHHKNLFKMFFISEEMLKGEGICIIILVRLPFLIKNIL